MLKTKGEQENRGEQWEQKGMGERGEGLNRVDVGNVCDYNVPVRLKKGKNVRLPESALPILEELRAKMRKTTHIRGVAVNPDIKLGDGAVCEWALTMSNYLMNPRFSVIDREDFAVLLDKHLGPLLETLAGCTDDERRNRLKLCISAASELGPYDATEPLRAAKPDGGVT